MSTWHLTLWGGTGAVEARGAITGLGTRGEAIKNLDLVESHDERVTRVEMTGPSGCSESWLRDPGTGKFARVRP